MNKSEKGSFLIFFSILKLMSPAMMVERESCKEKIKEEEAMQSDFSLEIN